MGHSSCRQEYRILTPAEFETVIVAIPPRFKALVLTDIETGLRWGELVALRPRHVDFLRRTITVAETIVEVSKKDSPTGERMIVKPYPKDDEPRTLHISQDLLDTLAARITDLGLSRDDLLFPPERSPTGTGSLAVTGHVVAGYQGSWRVRRLSASNMVMPCLAAVAV